MNAQPAATVRERFPRELRVSSNRSLTVAARFRVRCADAVVRGCGLVQLRLRLAFDFRLQRAALAFDGLGAARV